MINNKISIFHFFTSYSLINSMNVLCLGLTNDRISVIPVMISFLLFLSKDLCFHSLNLHWIYIIDALDIILLIPYLQN